MEKGGGMMEQSDGMGQGKTTGRKEDQVQAGGGLSGSSRILALFLDPILQCGSMQTCTI